MIKSEITDLSTILQSGKRDLLMSSNHTCDGFTGLEAAIVLIAFVVVAAVFAYVVLGAGFFTTQKSQEVVHTGIQQASSTLEIVGNVYGSGNAGSNSQIDFIQFSVALAPGGTPVDFSQVALTYSDSVNVVNLQQSPDSNPGFYPTTVEPAVGNWSVIDVQNDDGHNNKVLASGEQFTIKARPITSGIGPGKKFTIDIKPSMGAAFGISRTTPGGLQGVNILY